VEYSASEAPGFIYFAVL